MKIILRFTLGFLISAVCLWAVLRNFHLKNLLQAINQASLPLLWLALPVYLSAFFLRSFRWKLILTPVKPVSSLRILPVLSFGYLVNNVLPARAGEFARAMALASSEGLSTGSALGSIFVERVTDSIGLLFLILISITLFPFHTFPVDKILIFLGLGLAVGWVLLFFWNSYREKIYQKLSSHPISLKLIGFFGKFAEGLLALKSPTRMIMVLALTVGIWTIELITVWILSRGFKLYLTIPQTAGLMSGIIFGVLIPAAPGYIGTYEFFGQKTLTLMGFNQSVAISFVLSLHFFQLVISSILGIPVLFNKKAIPDLGKIKTFFKKK